MKVIELHESVTASNDRDAEALRSEMRENGTLLVNLMSSPGSGKTTLLDRTIRDIGTILRTAVLEADIDSDVDAKRIAALGARAIQVHTDGMCHMDAGMTAQGLHEMGYEGIDLAFLENVGNLICPAEYDTGAGKNVMILSVTEGDDKPLKYPLMFQTSDVLVISKIDALPYFDFDMAACAERARALNPDIRIFPVSAKTGEGMEAWEGWRGRPCNKTDAEEGKMKEQKNRMVNDRDYRLPENFVYPDKEKLKLLIRLAGMITDRYVAKYTHTIQPDDPEIWCLDEVMSRDEVKFMLSFQKTRTSYSHEQLVKKNPSFSEKQIDEMLQHLMWVGCIETNRENPKKELWYDVPIFVPGIAEFMVMNDRLMEEHPNIATFFNLMTQMPLEGITPMVPMGGGGIGMHVIPVEKAIESSSTSVPIEHISHWLEKYDGKLSIGVCTCRRQQRIRGEGDGSIEQECCIGLGDLAEWCVNTGRGHYITKEEASATPSAPRSCTTPRTCPGRHTVRMSTEISVWPAASVWRSARSARQSSARSSAGRMGAT